MRGDRIGGDRGGNPGVLRRPGLVLALALAVVLAGLGESASAAITGLDRVFATSPSTSSNKAITASCPSGKQVVGAGGQLISLSQPGQVVLGVVRPDAALTSVTAQGREDENGSTAMWSVTAFAICATPPPGLERVAAASPSNSANKSVTATCPAGKRLLGTGAEIEGGGGQVGPNDVIPGSTLTTATVQGLEDENGTGVSWRARAYAICAAPVAGLERVSVTTASFSSNKQATVSCPSGKRVTGVGGELGGGGGEVVLEDLTPVAGLLSAFATGSEDEDGTSSNWFARVFAICAAASERVVAASPNDSGSKAVTASCLGGKQVTGGGGDITGGGGQVLLSSLFPPNAEQFSVSGFEDEGGTPSNWLLRAYAICATPLPGLERVSNTSPTSSSNKSVIAACPPGKRVVGAGGGIFNSVGQVVLDDVAPNTGLTAVTATGIEDENGYADIWSVTAFAVCANPPPGLELVTAASDPDSDPGSVAANCPAGKNLLGTGAFISSGFGQVVLDDIRPDAALTRVTVTAFEDQTGLASDWTVTAHAICANP